MAKYVLMAKDECGDDFRVNDVVYEFPEVTTVPLMIAFSAYESSVIEEVRELGNIAEEWYNIHLELDYSSLPYWKVRDLYYSQEV